MLALACFVGAEPNVQERVDRALLQLFPEDVHTLTRLIELERRCLPGEVPSVVEDATQSLSLARVGDHRFHRLSGVSESSILSLVAAQCVTIGERVTVQRFEEDVNSGAVQIPWSRVALTRVGRLVHDHLSCVDWRGIGASHAVSLPSQPQAAPE